MFLGDIEPVERVEQNEAVALSNKERFPVCHAGSNAMGVNRFGDDHLGSKALPIALNRTSPSAPSTSILRKSIEPRFVPFA